MPNLLPNFSILRSPSNWFLVGFAVIVLVFTVHVFYKDEASNG